jgi:hypothetical protein
MMSDERQRDSQGEVPKVVGKRFCKDTNNTRKAPRHSTPRTLQPRLPRNVPNEPPARVEVQHHDPTRSRVREEEVGAHPAQAEGAVGVGRHACGAVHVHLVALHPTGVLQHDGGQVFVVAHGASSGDGGDVELDDCGSSAGATGEVEGGWVCKWAGGIWVGGGVWVGRCLCRCVGV